MTSLLKFFFYIINILKQKKSWISFLCIFIPKFCHIHISCFSTHLLHNLQYFSFKKLLVCKGRYTPSHQQTTCWIGIGAIKMKKVNNITDIQNGKQAMLCLCFVYLCKSRISSFRFLLLNDECIPLIAADIPLMQPQNVFKSIFLVYYWLKNLMLQLKCICSWTKLFQTDKDKHTICTVLWVHRTIV